MSADYKRMISAEEEAAQINMLLSLTNSAASSAYDNEVAPSPPPSAAADIKQEPIDDDQPVHDGGLHTFDEQAMPIQGYVGNTPLVQDSDGRYPLSAEQAMLMQGYHNNEQVQVQEYYNGDCHFVQGLPVNTFGGTPGPLQIPNHLKQEQHMDKVNQFSATANLAKKSDSSADMSHNVECTNVDTESYLVREESESAEIPSNKSKLFERPVLPVKAEKDTSAYVQMHNKDSNTPPPKPVVKISRRKTQPKKIVTEIQEAKNEPEAKQDDVAQTMFKCDLCEKSGFSTLANLKMHRKVHFQNTTCEVCNRSFRNQYDLKIHQESHNITKQYKCEKCEREYTHERQLKTHKCKVESTPETVQCDLCDRTFAALHLMKSHRRTHTKTKICPVCHKAFRNQYDMTRHLTTHAEQKPFRCEQCSKEFSYEKSLRNHVATCHPKEGEVVVRKPTPKRDKTVVCSVCDKTFRNNYELKLHHQKHTDFKPYSCHICNKEFFHESSMKRHVACQHRPQKNKKSSATPVADDTMSSTVTPKESRPKTDDLFQCSQCGKGFKLLYCLKEHEITHSDHRPYKCKHCDKAFKRPNALKGHELTYHCTEKPYECNVCHKRFGMKHTLTIHQRSHEKAKRYFCTMCNNSYSWYTSWKVHQQTHLGLTKPDKFTCDVCGKHFTRLTTLSMHKNIHVRERDDFVCQTCGKTFKWKISLRLHQQKHDGVLPYKCNICNKAFNRSYSLVVHKRKHTGENPYVCELCGASFYNLNCLRKHQTTHLPKDKLPRDNLPKDHLTKQKTDRFTCTYCNKCFAEHYNLKRHLQRRAAHSDSGAVCSVCNLDFCIPKMLQRHQKTHGITSGRKLRPKNHICAVCGKAFRKTSDLKQHGYVHSGLKPFTCETCGKGFTKNSDLKRHTYSHTGERPFHCAACGKGFIRRKELQRHEFSQHGIIKEESPMEHRPESQADGAQFSQHGTIQGQGPITLKTESQYDVAQPVMLVHNPFIVATASYPIDAVINQ